MSLGNIAAGVTGALGFGGSKGLGERKRAQDRLLEQEKQAGQRLGKFQKIGNRAMQRYRQGLGGVDADMPGAFSAGRMPGQFDSARVGAALDEVGTPGRFQFNLRKDPGYRFAKDEALRAARREMGAAGYNRSGNLLNELINRSAGVASQYANDAFNRQAGAYGINMDRSNVMHGRAMDRFGAGQTRANAIQGRRMDDFNADMSRSNEIFNRRMATHGANMDRSNILYGRDQNRLNRLQQLAAMGYDATRQRAANDMTAGTQMAGIWTGAAPAAQAQSQFQLQTLNNAIQGGVRNHLLQQYLQQQPSGVTPDQMRFLQNPQFGGGR